MLRLMNRFPCGHGCAGMLQFALLLAASCLSSPAMAAASVFCPTQNLSVTSGGSVVSADLATCDGPINIGMGGPPTAAQDPSHGTILLGGQQPNSSQFVTYSHNGDSAITDSFGLEDQNGGILTFNVTIGPAASAIVVSPASLPTLKAGTAFSQALSSGGGVAPYTYSLSTGTFPPGIGMTAGGLIAGTPTQRGGYSFSVRSQDSIGDFVIKGYTGMVQNPTLSLSPNTATAIQGVAFSQAVNAVGGVAPYSYLLETGPFPAGISISSAGVLSGTTAAAPGNYPVTLRVTDASTGPGTYFELEPFTLTVSPPPSVSIAVSPASVSEDGATNLIYTVTRSLNLSSPTVVNITTAGTATSGVDYSGGVASVSIPGGATTAAITINPTADATVEPNETVVQTVAAGTGYTVGAPASATGTILNDDVPSVSIAVAPSSVAEDGAANLVYTVTLSQAAATATSVNFAVSGTATSGVDYAAVTSPLAIAAGTTTGTITVNPTADATIEADETVTIGLSAGAGYTVGAPASATGTILNDDLPNLSINDVTLGEGDSGTSNATFTVSLSAPAGPGGVAFDIATANGTATAGVDYVANSLTGQTIPAGASSYSFTVVINGDTLNESSETFFVNVTNVIGAFVVDGQGVGTIVNDDPLPSLSINDVTVVEGNAGTVTATFTVTLSAPSGQNVSVNYASADGTATAPSDYTSVSNTLSFASGVTTRTIAVLVNGDLTPEASETFFVNLSGAVNATISDNQGIGTITNDDVPVTVNPASLPNGTVATVYSQTLSASAGVAPYTFSVTAGAPPGGLTLSPGGTLSGTPTAGGTFNFTVMATDSSPFPGPFSGSRAYTVTIAAPTISLLATPLADGTLGTAYSASLTPASGGTAPYAYAVTAGALPGGLILNVATGAITGTPSALGTFNFDVTATDGSTGTGPYTAMQSYSIVVVDVPPVATAASLTVAYNAAATPVTLNLSGGPPTSVAVASPASNGNAIATGTSITYQPTAGFAGSDSFTYTATNSGGTSASATVTVTVSDPVITITAGGGFAATVGTPYTQTFTWAGGASPYSGYQVTNLPTGLSITGTSADSVTVSGTPTQAGAFALNASATDSSTGNGPFTFGQPFALTVAPPVLLLTPAGTTFNAPYGAAYTQVFAASGGIGPYTYASTGSLPPGLSLAADTLSGTTTTPGNFTFSITATDTGSSGTGAPFTVTENYTIDIVAPTIVVAPATLPDPVLATPYSQTFSASGGVAPYSFAISAGVLPGGLILATDGTLSGTTTVVGSFNFTVTATDANSQTGTASYTVAVAAPILALSPAGGSANVTYGAAYSQTYAASGGAGPYTYALGGTPPTGLAFAGDTLSGTPTTPGSYSFTITATDTGSSGTGAPFTVTENYTIDVAAPTIVLTPATLPNPLLAMPYTQTLSASGGVAPYSFAISAGTLPGGLSLATNGTLSGTTNEVGNFSFTVTATDANSQSGAASYSLTIGAPTLALSPPGGSFNAGYAQPYSQTYVASGGAGPYTYALVGTLPTGLAFSGDTLSGTPTEPGSYSYSITATDTGSTGTGAPFTVVENYNLVITAPTIAVDPASLPNAATGVAYAQTLSATGGVAPYAFSIGAGSLPAGLALDVSGALSGTPTASGSATFDVVATDANGQTGTTSYVLVVTAPVLELASATLPAGQTDVAYTATLIATGGVPPYQYAVTAGSLPPGLTLDANGQLSGIPTVSDLFTFVVTVSDSDTPAASTSATFSLAISAVAPAQLPTLNGTGLLLLLSIIGLVGAVRLRRQHQLSR